MIINIDNKTESHYLCNNWNIRNTKVLEKLNKLIENNGKKLIEELNKLVKKRELH